MPKGGKLDRQVQHIKQSEMKSGKSAKKAESIAWGAIQNQKKGKGKGK